MSTDIPTQIRARLDAVAAERARLDDEERRLRKALAALEPTAAVPEETSEFSMLPDFARERMKKIAAQLIDGVAPLVEVETVKTAPWRDPINHLVTAR